METRISGLFPGDESLRQIFQGILEYSYDAADWEQDKDGHDERIVLESPLTFYDRHIDQNLNLKSIRNLKISLGKYLEALGIEEVANFIKQGRSISTQRPHGLAIPYHLNSSPTLAKDVKSYYYTHVGMIAARFAANLCIHPQQPTWNTCVFALYEPGTERDERVCKEVGLSVFRLQPLESVANSIPPQVADALRKLHQSKSTFAIWEVFASIRATKTLAWARAAVTDSTFIIFHCGRYERIGIRHRKTQTLYLSELVDTVLSSDPAYRALHIGLHLAIVKDLLDRKTSHPVESSVEDHFKRRRGSRPEDDVQRKRQKLDSETTKGGNSTDALKIGDVDLAEELESRMLALFYLDYGCYRSPAPSSFHRVAPSCSFVSSVESFKPPKRKSAYKPVHYFTLVLGPPLAEGAVGVGHPAEIIFVSTSRGSIRNNNLVVKLAFGEAEREKMWHEYRIYQHMWRNKDMKGIVKVYGMFQDAETGTLALLMEHGGTSATRREAARSGQVDVLHLTSDERDSLEIALTSIHEAGVVHGDVRSDNILVDGSNRFRIIDFDCATLEDPRTSLKMVFESQTLKGFLNVINST
ncbi:hypothetical protein NLJ89_g4668 [Agrocybe chaxingu]|uniref:Protein kinase domain-containing protein n=1 Tax=Agrocybe chaxingu TaxID=84603 RepID=A0A9W8K2M1_9AGAR|nr:hypothetical protein NLJ89_g4668 [Agrocybe chaxingu]